MDHSSLFRKKIEMGLLDSWIINLWEREYDTFDIAYELLKNDGYGELSDRFVHAHESDIYNRKSKIKTKGILCEDIF